MRAGDPSDRNETGRDSALDPPTPSPSYPAATALPTRGIGLHSSDAEAHLSDRRGDLYGPVRERPVRDGEGEQALGTSSLPGDRSHFAGLDALRGLAALVVVILHAAGPLSIAISDNAGLAVDFFFVLSGFVIGHAYEARLQEGTLTAARFVRLRIVRLHPLLIAGTAIALAFRFVQAARGASSASQGEALFAAVTAILCLPYHRLSDSPQLFPLNFPQWSLLAEYLVNFAYVLLLPWLGRVGIAIAILGGLVALVGITIFHGTIVTGYFLADWKLGPIRAVYPFLVGIVIARGDRAGWLPRFDLPWIIQAAVLLAILFGPANAAFQLFAATILFPLIIVGGRADRLTGRARDAALWAGAVSYPIYILHLPIVRALSKLQPHAIGPYPWLALQLAAVLIFSHCAGLVDGAVRRQLGSRRKSRGAG